MLQENEFSVFLRHGEQPQEHTALTSIRNESFPFTPVELEVLQLVANGCTNLQIARALKTSVRTIETRRASLMRKSGTNNTATLIKYAVRNDLVQ